MRDKCFLIVLLWAILVGPLPAVAQEVIATVPVGYDPYAIAVNPATNKIYVIRPCNQSMCHEGTGIVTVIDGVTYETVNVIVGRAPVALAVNPVTNKIYVVNRCPETDPQKGCDLGTVTVIDGKTNNTDTITVGYWPGAIAINSVTNKIYVSNLSDDPLSAGPGTVTVIDGNTEDTTTVDVGFPYEFAVAINMATNKIYVVNSCGIDEYGCSSHPGTVTVIDGRNNTTSTVVAGKFPYAVAVNSTTNKVYVPSFYDNAVTIIDGATNATDTISVATEPIDVAVNSVTNKIYVVSDCNEWNCNTGGLTVVDGLTNSTLSLDIGSLPTMVRVNEATNEIYASNSNCASWPNSCVDPGSISAIDGTNNTVASILVGLGPVALAINENTDRIYVANTGSGTVSVIKGSLGVVNIDRISMFDSHTLEVDVTAQFSQNPTTSKQMGFKTTIEDVQLERILPLPPTDTGLQSQKLFVDFGSNNVPLFQDNQTFDVTATATEEQQQIGSDTEVGEIPLPVVHIHGLLTDCIGDRIPHGLFAYLEGDHPSYVEDDGLPDGQGANNELTKSYPTLVSFDYKSLQNSATTIAENFAAFIKSQVLEKTYAQKVDIVAHSLGGIIARQAIATGGIASSVNAVILVGSPSEGADLAALVTAYWNRYRYIDIYLKIREPGVEWLPIIGCFVTGTKETTSEMLPVYPWWAPSRSDAQQHHLEINPDYPNPLLPGLNATGLDPNVYYYALVASGKITPTIFWNTWEYWVYPELLDTLAWDLGDGIVPIRSQRADDTSWPKGDGPGQLNVYFDVGPIFHTGYFESVLIQKYSERILWSDVSNSKRIIKQSLELPGTTIHTERQ